MCACVCGGCPVNGAMPPMLLGKQVRRCPAAVWSGSGRTHNNRKHPHVSMHPYSCTHTPHCSCITSHFKSIQHTHTHMHTAALFNSPAVTVINAAHHPYSHPPYPFLGEHHGVRTILPLHRVPYFNSYIYEA